MRCLCNNIISASGLWLMLLAPFPKTFLASFLASRIIIFFEWFKEKDLLLNPEDESWLVYDLIFLASDWQAWIFDVFWPMRDEEESSWGLMGRVFSLIKRDKEKATFFLPLNIMDWGWDAWSCCLATVRGQTWPENKI